MDSPTHSRFLVQASGRARTLSFDGGRGAPPLLASAQTSWAGVPFELHRTQPVEGERHGGPPDGEHSLLMVVSGRTEVVLRERGRDVHYRCGPGTLSLHSSNERPTLRRVTGSAELLVVRLSSAWRERLLPSGFPSSLGYQPPMQPDATLCALAESMCTEIRRGAPTGRLFAESLSLALLAYAIDKLPITPMQVRGALSPDQQRRLRRHIEDRLHEDISVTELAALCGLRPRHFTTLFRDAFGCTPHRYVISRRVARGAELLTTSAVDVNEIALRLGFCSASHFAVEFRRVHGVSPRFARSRCLIAGT